MVPAPLRADTGGRGHPGREQRRAARAELRGLGEGPTPGGGPQGDRAGEAHRRGGGANVLAVSVPHRNTGTIAGRQELVQKV